MCWHSLFNIGIHADGDARINDHANVILIANVNVNTNANAKANDDNFLSLEYKVSAIC